ncbi:MAG: hypothetical protein H0U39_02820 [Segetibacter sp.]|nr:hypothetical protein [Segetibacter sp.]
MSTIKISIYQKGSYYSIVLTASTANGIVWLPITLQQFKQFNRWCIGNSIMPGNRIYFYNTLPF